jgi:hypothetical protein
LCCVFVWQIFVTNPPLVSAFLCSKGKLRYLSYM